MTVGGGMALPLGNAAVDDSAVDVTGARARARARVAATRSDGQRDGNVVTLPVAPPAAAPNEGSVRAGAKRAAEAGKLTAAIRRTAATVVADVSGSWLLRAHPPALADRWAARIPEKARVPGRCATPASTALWVGWLVANHLTLPVTVVLYALAWVHEHPARFIPLHLTALAVLGLWLT